MTGIIQLERLNKNYGAQVAVSDLSLQVAEGEFLTLLGGSGSGKTTTLRMIAGLEVPSSGIIRFRGQDITHQPSAERGMRMVFQDFALFPNLSVRDNVAFGLRLRHSRGRFPEPEIARRVDRFLESVQLTGHDGKFPHQLSGGQRQRVALARALVTDPAVVLFDEPLGSLDASMRKAMQLELKRLHRELGKTFIYVTHDQEEAMGLSDRVAVLQNARLLQIATPEEIYFRPASVEVARFIGAANLIEGTVSATTGAAGADGVVQVRLPGGARLDASQAVAGLAPGTRVVLMLRAEQLRLAARGAGPDSGLAAQITDRLFLGEKMRYELRLASAETTLTALCPADSGDYPIGAQVLVTTDPRFVRVIQRSEATMRSGDDA